MATGGHEFTTKDAELEAEIMAAGPKWKTFIHVFIHGFIIVSGFGAVVSVQNSLLSFYSEVEMEIAHKLFDEMCGRDLISWSVMIGGYVQSGEAGNAFMLFCTMTSNNEIEMDGQIMVNAIKACSRMGEVRIAKLLHGFVMCTDFCYDLFVASSLVDMYAKCDDIESASKRREIGKVNGESQLVGVFGF